MVVYNLGAVALFVFAGIGLGLHAIASWPAAVLHAMMAGWCVRVLIVSAAKSSPLTSGST
jgi:hypothetical protein